MHTLIRKGISFFLCLFFSISTHLLFGSMSQDNNHFAHYTGPLNLLALPDISSSELQQGDLVGSGSFGDVYKGTWRGQEVAIKRLRMRTLDPHMVQDSNAETQLMWRCQFPNILRLYGVCKEPGQAAMIFELMPRGSLYGVLHSGEPIPERRQWQIAIDIAQGLTDLHRNNILHRDLKSHNILLDESYRAKISDFGLAKLKLATSTASTHASHSSGTVRWRAPELFSLRPQTTPALDMYSYGMVLWEIVSRKIPFAEQPDDLIVVSAVKSGEREEIPANCPPVWQAIIKECWQQEPSCRPSAATVLERLKQACPKSSRPIWLSEETFPAAAIPASGFVVFPAALQDWQKVLAAYWHHRVAGYDVGKVEVIYNPAMNDRFAATLTMLQLRKGSPRYTATWDQRPDSAWRSEIQKHLATIAAPYQDEGHPDVKLMPLWHGTSSNNLVSLLSAGYAPFGDSDDGYFGKGIYAAHEASYAELYANGINGGAIHVHNPDGVLLLNWGATYSSFPVVAQDYNSTTHKLVTAIESGKYDSRFIPVVQNPKGNMTDYMPTQPQQLHIYTEVMMHDSAQLLPRYLVTLQPARSAAMQSGNVGFGMTSQGEAMFAALKRKLETAEEQVRQDLKVTLVKDYQAGLQVLTNLEKTGRKIAEEWQNRKTLHQLQLADHAQMVLALKEEFKKTLPQTSRLVIPDIARGYEEIYRRFYNGKLIYKPMFNSDVGKIELPIASLADPLNGTFDLSRCGNAGQHLSIATGYRKLQKAENANKYEIWFAPRFLVASEVNSLPANHHMREILKDWDGARAPVGIFWTCGRWDVGSQLSWCNYLTVESMDDIRGGNLYKKAVIPLRGSLRSDRFVIRGGSLLPTRDLILDF
jgi:serine/threonine protein kinase